MWWWNENGTTVPARVSRLIHLGWEIQAELTLDDGQVVTPTYFPIALTNSIWSHNNGFTSNRRMLSPFRYYSFDLVVGGHCSSLMVGTPTYKIYETQTMATLGQFLCLFCLCFSSYQLVIAQCPDQQQVPSAW